MSACIKMKPINKLLLNVISLFVILPVFIIFTSNNINAQGTCECAPGSPCTIVSNNCDIGYVLHCTNMSGDVCTMTGCECILPPPPSSSSLDWDRLYGTIQTSGGVFDFSNSTPGLIVSASLRIIFPLAGLVLLLMMLYGGYNLMLSGGDPKRAQAAKSILTTALVGFIIIFIAFWLVNIIGRVLGLGEISSIFS